MSRTLNLLEKMLTRAQTLQGMGRWHKAVVVLQHLARWPNLPLARDREVQQGLGEAYFQLRKFKHARRHFRQAIQLQPEQAAGYLQLARAIDHDPLIDARQASRYYRRALAAEPNDPDVLRECGRYAVQMGRTRKGMKLLRRAAELAPNDLDVVQALVEALVDLQQFNEARKTLRLARFRHHRNSMFQQIWDDFEYRHLRWQQRGQTTPASAEARPITVPFLRLHSPEKAKKVRVVRRDVSSNASPHFPRVRR
jgi:tetratricopeptide (TPR) repeat protein